VGAFGNGGPWQFEPEDTAVGGGRHPHPSPVGLGETFDCCEPQSNAWKLRAVAPYIGFEDLRLCLRGEPGSRVLDFDPDQVPSRPGPELNASLRCVSHVFDGIADEVLRQADQDASAAQHLRRGFYLGFEQNAPCFCFRPEFVKQLWKKPRDVRSGSRGGFCTGFRKLEQIIHDPLHAFQSGLGAVADVGERGGERVGTMGGVEEQPHGLQRA